MLTNVSQTAVTAKTLNAHDSEKPTQNRTAAGSQAYQAPRIFVIGTALDLVQGYAGRYYDGYSGYYTDRRG